MRQRRLELLGDDPRAHRDVVGRRVEHDDVAEADVRRLDLRGLDEAELAERLARVERLVVDLREDLARSSRSSRCRAGCCGDRLDGLRRRVERQLAAEERVALHRLVQLRDHVGAGGVVGRDLQRPDVGAFVVRHRAEQEAAIGRGVLVRVELGQRRHDRVSGPGQVLRGEVVVDLELVAVLEVEGVVVVLIEDDLPRARAGDGRVERLRREHQEVVEAADLGQVVGRGAAVGGRRSGIARPWRRRRRSRATSKARRREHAASEMFQPHV